MTKGIYPVYLYYRAQHTLVLAYGVSSSKQADANWNFEQIPLTIKEYFKQENIENPKVYKESYVYRAYPISPNANNYGLNEQAVLDDLENITMQFKERFSGKTTDDLKPQTQKPTKHNTLFAIIKTKPFILLAGLSGTGKTRLVKELAYLFCPKQLQSDQSPGNYQLIKVKPNWHDSSDLIGYESRINKPQYIITDFIRFIAKAWLHPESPFFLCLDEMNLAPVEQYFAEYLSILETRFWQEDKLRSESFVSPSIFNKYDEDEFWEELQVENDDIKMQFKEIGLTMPRNLIVMGTVNMDETTFSFSRKVLDRAMSLEINEIDLSLGLDDSANIWKYPETPYDADLVIPNYTHGYHVADKIGSLKDEIIKYLNEVNNELENTPFKVAYRVRDEFLLFAYNYKLSNSEANINTVLDEMTLIKILPRIEGDEDKTDVLEGLIEVFTQYSLDKSIAKANLMNELRTANHYTSFWT
ncbi:MAG TPA: AAA family ATPase [Candidatus Cloacimonadota bacterium]|nr:AAA family ATPase [Candidatus Cloacimonadota bacterium]